MIVPPQPAFEFDSLDDLAGSYRFTVAQYHALVRHAVLTTEDKVELIEGYVLYKLDYVTLPPPSPHFPRWQQLRRWTQVEYDRIIALGIISPEDGVKLIDGYLVFRPSRDG